MRTITAGKKKTHRYVLLSIIHWTLVDVACGSMACDCFPRELLGNDVASMSLRLLVGVYRMKLLLGLSIYYCVEVALACVHL